MESLQRQVREQDAAERRAVRKARALAEEELGAPVPRSVLGGTYGAGDSEEDEDEDEEYSSEDESGKLLTLEKDAQVFRALNAIRSKDRSIYDANTVFFSDADDDSDEDADDSDDGAGARAKAQQAKPAKKMTLGALIAKKAAAGEDAVDDSEEEEQALARAVGRGRHATVRTHADEQEALRQAFFAAEEQGEKAGADGDGDSDGDGELFGKARSIYQPGDDDDSDDDASAGATAAASSWGMEGGEALAGGAAKAAKAKAKAAKAAKADTRAGKPTKARSGVSGAAAGAGAVGDDVSAQERFLREYIMNDWWRETDSSKLPSAEAILGKDRGKVINDDAAARRKRKADGEASLGDSDDDAAAERGDYDPDADDEQDEAADRFEAEYNFRFEEPGANELMAYPRAHQVEGSMRKKNDRRKLQRERKAERLRAEKQRKVDEIRRLKNVKRKAIMERLLAIGTVSGLGDRVIGERMGDDEEDGQRGREAEEDADKPRWDDEDEDAAVERLKQRMVTAARKKQQQGGGGGDDDEEEEEEEHKGGKQGKKGKGKGGKDKGLTAKDLLDDWDAEAHDRRMNEVFGEEFYGALADDEEALDREEQALQDEPDLALGDADDDAADAAATAEGEEEEGEEADEEVTRLRKETAMLKAQARKKESVERAFIKKTLGQVFEAQDASKEAENWVRGAKQRLAQKIVGGGDSDSDNDVAAAAAMTDAPAAAAGGKAQGQGKGKGKKGGKVDLSALPAEAQEQLKAELATLDALDKEDALAGTRFSYREVPANDFGLEIEDLLNMTDRELGQRVSMKKLAPYRDDDWDGRETWWTMKGKKARPEADEESRMFAASQRAQYRAGPGAPPGQHGRKPQYAQGLGFKREQQQHHHHKHQHGGSGGGKPRHHGQQQQQQQQQPSKSPFADTGRRPMDQPARGHKRHRAE